MRFLMGHRVPAVVGLYLRESGQWRRIAEFRLAADGRATFRAVDPIEGLVARVWYHQGVDVPGEDRRVLPQDGAEFLRALLQPFGFRDYRFRDDSPASATHAGASTGRGERGLGRTGRAAAGGSTVCRRHAAARAGADEKVTAGADSECTRCAEAESEPRAQDAGRPAAWRALDADTLRF
ncbi:hypothetical protein ABZ319_28225 [Nocardia sp. NPDC005978]|uniref:hypothetical protein n=1 Tax=Nocardia sp. NPDC005978 TaxID=3156725 RepID=UPI0033AD6F36